MLAAVLTLRLACFSLLLSLPSGTPNACTGGTAECEGAGSDTVELLQHFSAVDRGTQRHNVIAKIEESKTHVQRGDAQAADLVIVGIGDSGTRGVKDTFENLGMKFSPNQDLYGSGDSQDVLENDGYSPYLLYVAGGHISAEGYKNNPELWANTLTSIKSSLEAGFRNIVENSSDLTMDSNVIWGLKSPGQYYLLPGYDAATNNVTKYLFVARDPRDLCTHEPDGKHNATEKMMRWFGVYQAGTENGTDCYGYWASSMADMFALYENEPRFRILRIEDLVSWDPAVTNISVNIYQSLADFVGLQRQSYEAAVDWLSYMHTFNTSYQGYHYDMTDSNRTERQVDFLKHAQEHPVELTLMDKLGYRVDVYGKGDLGVPSSSSVLRG